MTWELLAGFILAMVICFWVGFRLGIDYEFKRISTDPNIKFIVELGRRMKGEE